MTPNEGLAREIVYSDWGDDSTLLARITAALDAKDQAMAEIVEEIQKSMGEMGPYSLSYHILKNALAALKKALNQ